MGSKAPGFSLQDGAACVMTVETCTGRCIETPLLLQPPRQNKSMHQNQHTKEPGPQGLNIAGCTLEIKPSLRKSTEQMGCRKSSLMWIIGSLCLFYLGVTTEFRHEAFLQTMVKYLPGAQVWFNTLKKAEWGDTGMNCSLWQGSDIRQFRQALLYLIRWQFRLDDSIESPWRISSNTFESNINAFNCSLQVSSS